ncbi:MAG: SMC-Scp complex subunit ScpB [Deltaproteobacteria bacterium]|nr:SMC-Scp complex subunit ScpB [Deltaproteobacteria bacterium]
MLSKEKQKAIIEAMLFVSTQPVPVSKMKRRLKKANDRLFPDNQNPENQNEDLETLNTNEDEESANNIVTQPDVVDSEDQEANQEEAPAEQLEAAVDQEESDDNADNTDNEEWEADNEEDNDDALGQLLAKQKEFDDDISASDIKNLLKEIQEQMDLEDRGIELVQVAKGYQFRTKYEISELLKDEKVKAPSRFSPSSLETLAIVAYEQPVTRQKIEEVRGVDSGGVLKTLLDKGILKIVGRSDEPGKPLIYGTTGRFLEVFGINRISDLPSLHDFHALQGPVEEEDQINVEEQGYFADLESSESEVFSVDEAEILNSLDSSLQNLKEVEKTVLESQRQVLGEEEANEEQAQDVEQSSSESSVSSESKC